MSSHQFAQLGRHMFQGKRLLLFDFDGTVADTTPLHAAAFAQVLSPLGITVDYPSIAGLKTTDAMRLCLASGGMDLTPAELSSLVAAKQKCVRVLILDGLKPLPGADVFLRRAQQHYRLAMVTSGSRGTVELALEKLGYVGWFDPLICAEDVLHAKPNPEGFSLALRTTGVSADSALVFEDSHAGFQAAVAAGLEYIDIVSTPWKDLTEFLP